MKIIDPRRIAFPSDSDGRIKEVEAMAAQEVETLRKLSEHPGIVSLEAAFFSSSTRQVFIVTEFVSGGHLFSHLVCRAEPLPEQEASHIVAQLSDALAFCHSRGVVHRDVKLENVLVLNVDLHLVEERNGQDSQAAWRTQEVFTVKLCDFGLAKALTAHAARTPVGTPNYAAPEVVPTASFYDAYKADAFSLGVLIFVTLCLGFPYKEGGAGSHREHKRWPQLSGNAKDLLDGLLAHDPGKRLSLPDVLKHPWVAKLKVHGSPLESEQCEQGRHEQGLHVESTSYPLDISPLPSLSPKCRVPDPALAGVLALNRAVVELQHERGMACYAITQTQGLGGLSCWEQLRRHIRATDRRISEASALLAGSRTWSLRIGGAGNSLAIPDLERARQLALDSEKATSVSLVAFDEVFLAYNQAYGALNEVVARSIEAVSRGHRTVRRFRLFSAAAELIARERGFGLSVWMCNDSNPNDYQGCQTSAVRLPARTQRLAEILGARKVLLGTMLVDSAMCGQMGATSTGLLGSLVGEEGEPPLLSAKDIAALECIEEKVLDPSLGPAPLPEWWTALTQLVKQIHGRIAIDLVEGLRSADLNPLLEAPCCREVGGSSVGKGVEALFDCGCRLGLKRLLQGVVDRL